MAKEEYIREFGSQKILGVLKTEPNGDQTAIDFPSRRILGYYKAKYNHTTNFIGTIISQGNTVVSLIYNKK